MRDSIDDYEYLAIVQRLGLAAEAEKIVLPLAGSWFQWDPDPASYGIAREKLAKMIVAARGGKSLGKSAGPAAAGKEHQTRVRAKVDVQWRFVKGNAAVRSSPITTTETGKRSTFPMTGRSKVLSPDRTRGITAFIRPASAGIVRI